MTRALSTLVMIVLTLAPLACGDRGAQQQAGPAAVLETRDAVSGASVRASLSSVTTDVARPVTLEIRASWLDGSRVEWVDPAVEINGEQTGSSAPQISLSHRSALGFEDGVFTQVSHYTIEPVLPGSFVIGRSGVRVDLADGTRRVCRVGTFDLIVESVLNDPGPLTLAPSVGFPDPEQSARSNTPAFLLAAVLGAVSLIGIVALTRRGQSDPSPSPMTPADATRELANAGCTPERLRLAARTLEPLRGTDPRVSELVSLIEHALYSGTPPRADAIMSLSGSIASDLERTS